MNSSKPLYGLVICGGQSTRMGSDKSLIAYHSEPQRYHLCKELDQLCERVFISCKKEQLSGIPASYHVIVDAPEYEGHGPISALMSAFEEYPDAAFLVVAVDYPNLKTEHLKELIRQRSEDNVAVSFINSKTSITEPLIAIYEADSFPALRENFARREYSLRAFLEQQNTRLLNTDPELFVNVNTPEDLQRHRAQLK